jgi:hypothetical protein
VTILLLSVGQNFFLAVLFFYYLDDGMTLLAHLLPAGYACDCFFSSATAPNRKQIEAKNTSRYQKTEKFFDLLLFKGKLQRN